MKVLITYDVKTASLKGEARLRKVAKVCTNYGLRVQNSVFECTVSEVQFIQIKALLQSIINSNEDSIRFYRLGTNSSLKIEHIGIETTYDVEGDLII